MNRVDACSRTAIAGALVAAALLLAGCGGEDRPGSVSVIGDGGTGSVSGSVSGVSGVSGSASGTNTGAPGESGESGELGGYEPVSNVAEHAKITLDVAEINELLSADPIDWDAVRRLYEEGEHSRSGDDMRTLAGFARAERSEPVWDDYVRYYGDATWLDSFVMHALAGTGPFEGESDAVRKQGAQKGIQNQILIAWMVHELVAAQQKAAAGETDPATGAPHNWDEGWAFYHGEAPGAAPYATAEKRGENFGTGSAVNEAILAAMQEGLQATQDGDAQRVQAAVDAVLRQIAITYVQAAIRYATLVEADLEAGDEAKAREHQAEGWAFYRVIEPLVAEVDAQAAETVADALDLASEPGRSASRCERRWSRRTPGSGSVAKT